MERPRHVATVALPTPYGEFEGHAFETDSGYVYLALVRGEVATGPAVLTRLHSECLTGDALAHCAVIAASSCVRRCGRSPLKGVGSGLRDRPGGTGIGLVNKLLAYVEQDHGADTVDANLRLGLPVDLRSYDDAAAVLYELGVRSIRLITNNPAKVTGLRSGRRARRAGSSRSPTAAHFRNNGYVRTKQERLGHHDGATPLNGWDEPVVDVTELLGTIRTHADRPYVVLKYAQTLDGRIATASGDSKWISGADERAISHALRAACDAVLVGVGTVVSDDPQLTVRMVPGASPVRVVLDSTLRTPGTARILDDDASTIVYTTDRASAERVEELQSRQIGVRLVPAGAGGVDISPALHDLYAVGVRSLLVEGGAKVITAMLAAGHVDRLIVAVAPTIIGAGTEAVGDLGIATVASGLRLTNRSLHVMDDDLLIAWDIETSAVIA